MSDTLSGVDSSPQQKPPIRWFRFSLKSLLLVMALVAVYFGGRASMRPNWFAPQAGTWQMNMPSGHQRAVALTTLPEGLFLLGTGGVLSGQYRWKGGQLQVVLPSDNRYMGLAWGWDGDELVLIAEPANHPSGAVYLGTRLRFVSPDTSTAMLESVPVVPSRLAVQQAKQRGLFAPKQNRLAGFQPEPWHDPTPGERQVIFPAGFKRTVKLEKLSDGQFMLDSRDALSGTYQVRDGEMQVVVPDDPRMKGLAWAWQKDELVLVSEPSPPPTGASYVGARMRPTTDSQQQLEKTAEGSD